MHMLYVLLVLCDVCIHDTDRTSARKSYSVVYVFGTNIKHTHTPISSIWCLGHMAHEIKYEIDDSRPSGLFGSQMVYVRTCVHICVQSRQQRSGKVIVSCPCRRVLSSINEREEMRWPQLLELWRSSIESLWASSGCICSWVANIVCGVRLASTLVCSSVRSSFRIVFNLL